MKKYELNMGQSIEDLNTAGQSFLLPYYWGLKKVEADEAIGTARMNGVQMKVNPVWWNEDLVRNSRAIILAHEMLHLAGGHHLRRGSCDPEHWNIACDKAVNQYLVTMPGWALLEKEAWMPEGGELPFQTAEYYYRTSETQKVAEQKKEDSKDEAANEDLEKDDMGSAGNKRGDGQAGGKGKEGNGKDAGEGEGDGDGQAGARGPDSGPDEGVGNSKSAGGKGAEAGKGSAGQGDAEAVQRAAKGDGNPFGKIEDCPDKDKAKAEQVWQVATAQAEAQAKEAGTMPGWLKETVEAMKPKTDWKGALREYLLRSAHTKRTFARPSRRFSWRRDTIFPARGGKTLGKIVVAVDTSGSMNAELLKQALGVICELMTEYPTSEGLVMEFDTAVRNVTPLTPAILSKPWEWHGRGGTNFADILEKGAKENPDVLVMFTDGYASFPEKAPQVPVLWLMCSSIEAPWGRTVRLKM